MLQNPYNKRLKFFYQNPVKVSKRLNVNNVTYHSKGHKRVGNKRRDYAIKNMGKNDLFEFGMIKYFIKTSTPDKYLISEFIIENEHE